VNHKIFRGALLLASVCLVSAAVSAQQPRARRGGLDNLSLPSTTARVASASAGARAWQTFAPEGAGFSVSVPGLPEEPTRAGREGGQAAAQFHSYRLTSGGLKYEFGRTGRMPEQLLAQADYVERFFAGASQGITAALAQAHQQVRFKLVSEETISLDGYEGREYEFAAAGQRAVARLFLVDGSVFALSVIGPNSEMTPENVSRFLNSFALAQ
jgi:hypothetical protein